MKVSVDKERKERSAGGRKRERKKSGRQSEIQWYRRGRGKWRSRLTYRGRERGRRDGGEGRKWSRSGRGSTGR